MVASSSGGNWLKTPGRGGLCSIPGAGVWCEPGKGCVCSGFGESCIRLLLAKRVCDCIECGESSIQTFLVETLPEEGKRMHVTLPSSFGIAAVSNHNNSPVLHIGHSSPTFVYGYLNEAGQIHVETSEKQDQKYILQTIKLFFVYLSFS